MKQFLIYIFLLLFLVLLFIPICFLLAGMLIGKDEAVSIFMPILNGEGQTAIFLFPQYPTFNAITNLLFKTTNFYRAFWNSCSIVVPIAVLQILVAAPAAWSFSQFHFRYKSMLYFMYLFFMILPFITTMLPNYLIMQRLNILDSYLSIILPATFSTLPVFIMERFFAKIPTHLIDEVKCIGANDWTIFWHIGIPLGFPGILASAIFSFSKYWNDVEAPMLFLNTQSKWPSSLWLADVSVGLFSETMTACIVNSALPLLIYIYGLRQLKRIGDVINGQE